MESQSSPYDDLLYHYSLLPKQVRNLTFMNVAGYSHYENVCSNILSFYLNPNEEHGLGDLLLRSLVKLYSQPGKDTPIEYTPSERVDIYREYSTDLQKRIDLVIETDSQIIAIENKVYHWVANDLNHYSDAMEDLEKKNGNTDSKREILNFLLAPIKYNSSAETGKFCSITYRELWSQLESDLGANLFAVNQKWLSYLLDFIQTTKQFKAIFTMEITERDQFIISRQTEIQNLINDRNNLQNRLNQHMQNLAGHIANDVELNKNKLIKGNWIWQKSVLVFDLLDNKGKIAIDLVLSLEGWTPQLFGRDKEGIKKLEYLKDIEPLSKFVEPKVINGRYHSKTWELTTDLKIIHQGIKEMVYSFHEAMNKLPE